MLQHTELYCRGQGLPFPHVEPSPQDQHQPRECHLFSDPTCPDAPVLLHFPLVNASFKDHLAPGEAAPPSLTAWQPGPSPVPLWSAEGESLRLVRSSFGLKAHIPTGALCEVAVLLSSLL